MTATIPALDPAFVAAFRAGTLTLAQTEATLPQDRAAVIFLLLQLSAAVLMRKASFGNQSDRGVRTRGVLMSVLGTLKRRGLELLRTGAETMPRFLRGQEFRGVVYAPILTVIADALRTYTATANSLTCRRNPLQTAEGLQTDKDLHLTVFVGN